MDITQLLQGREDCPCGRKHYCPVETVVVEKGIREGLLRATGPYRSILLVADRNTYRVQGESAALWLGEKVTGKAIFDQEGVLVPDEMAIGFLEAQVGEKTDLILGVGSGVINDLCKYVSFQKNLPYFILATAPSMDGYASNGAALILDGMKISPNARPPKAILADTQVLKDAPMEMIQAGYGDIVGKLSCLNDWQLSALINKEYFCDYVYGLTYDTVQELLPMGPSILARDENAVKLLMEALVKVGIAMSFVGNSRPASGSEHHLSHFFEITGIINNRPYYPHGIDVAYSAVLTAQLRRQLLHQAPIQQKFCRQQWEGEIRRIYGPVAPGVIGLQDRLGSYAEYAKNVNRTDWEQIRQCLAQAPDPEQMRRIVESVGLRYEDFATFYGEKVLADAVKYGKDLKDRYSVLWLYHQFAQQ